MDNRAIVNELFDILSMKEDIKNIDKGQILHKDVIAHVDWIKLNRGLEGWKTWVGYLHRQMRRHRKVVKFEIQKFVELETDKNKVHVEGVLFVQNSKNEIFETPFKVDFIFKDQKIAEIYSTRDNYTAILGNSFRYLPGTIWHFLRAVTTNN